MDMLKQKWRLIVFAAVVVGSIGLGAWGVMRGDAIRKDMEVPDQIIGKLKDIEKRGGANPEMIDARRRELEKAKEEVARAIKSGQELQEYNAFDEEVAADGKVTRKKREPIVLGCLPKPASESVAFNFRSEYITQLGRLAKRLNAGPPPGREEIRIMETML